MNEHSAMNRKQRQTTRGFSLVEMAIVLAIVALLMAGLLPTLSGQMEQQHRNDTRKKMDEIQQALIGYAVINGRLPCPADGTTPTGQANADAVQAGLEYKNPAAGTPFVCKNAIGVLPWATLGVNETDAWGRRYTYSVTGTFSNSTGGVGCSGNTKTNVAFELCDPGTLTVLSAVGGTNISTNIPAVIVSHGSNGCGAYTPTGSLIPIAVGNGAGGDCSNAGNDQVENTNVNTNFVNHDFTPSFDDLVVWISPNILFNRMVTAGKLP